jgi:hypothetical protein
LLALKVVKQLENSAFDTHHKSAAFHNFSISENERKSTVISGEFAVEY